MQEQSVVILLCFGKVFVEKIPKYQNLKLTCGSLCVWASISPDINNERHLPVFCLWETAFGRDYTCKEIRLHSGVAYQRGCCHCLMIIKSTLSEQELICLLLPLNSGPSSSEKWLLLSFYTFSEICY